MHVESRAPLSWYATLGIGTQATPLLLVQAYVDIPKRESVGLERLYLGTCLQ